MIMDDSSFYEYPNFNDQTIVLDMLNEYQTAYPYDDPMSSSISSSFSAVRDDGEYSDSVIKHINQVLMEEEESFMFHDPLVLQATEESLYRVIKGGDENPLWVVDQNEDRKGYEIVGSDSSEVMSPDAVIKNDLMAQFNRGVDDGSEFLPSSCQLISESYDVADRETGDVVAVSRITRMQSADFVEGELSDQFGKALLDKSGENKEDHLSQNGVTNGVQQQDVQVSRKARGKKRGDKKEVIDLSGLLISCAEAVGADLRGVASELLRQIRQHSTPSGDYTQRLAHWFANALEVRLAGTGSELYTNWSRTTLSAKPVTGAQISKFYRAFIAVFPYMKMIMIFANHMILKASEKADTLHIIDFGVRQGLQWPALIHCLSKRPGGPPKLRITGIELPISGCQPEETVRETGNRLANYCKRFGVPFEYHAIAKNWETLQLDDLNVQSNEVLAVHCLCRFKYLLDESVMVNNPRDTVLNLIRKLNPDIFVHSIVNGSHDAPFFVPRFREALFHFSAFLDLLGTTFSRENQMRLGFEREYIGREIFNVVACEGTERIVRPETYKQWQIRNMRAGFTQLPLDYEVVNKIKDKVKTEYHKYFVVDEDGHWLLQGWKGRMMIGSSCWVPNRT